MLIRRTQLCMYRRQCRLFPRKLLVKVARIGGVANGREVRWRDASVIDIFKVDIFEEEMTLDILGFVLAVSKRSIIISSE